MNTLKIFVVDDDKFYLNIFQQHLTNLGCVDVTIFDNGTDCLNQLSEKPDVVFLDYNMENLNGYDVLKKIKRFDPNLYVVMVSAQDEIKPAVDSLKHGAFDYLQKGHNELEKIQTVLKSILEIRELLEQSKPNFLKKLFTFL